MIAWVGRRVRRAVQKVIRAAKDAHDEQVYAWECILRANRAAPQSAIGPMRWVNSLDGYRLVGSHLPAQDQSQTGS
jgi:hypothetical protein